MDLTLKDVAGLLNVTEETLRDWVHEGRVPAYRLNRQYRFSRMEIEDWLIQQKLTTSEPIPGDADLRFSLFKAMHHGEVLSDVPAQTKEELILLCMEHMAERFSLDAGVLTDLFMDRERRMSTGLGYGIAVPHTRDFLLNTHFDVVLTVYPSTPIEYDSLDGLPVHVCFFIFAANDRRHLHLLSKIAHLSSSKEFRNFLTGNPSKDLLMQYVKNWENQLTASD